MDARALLQNSSPPRPSPDSVQPPEPPHVGAPAFSSPLAHPATHRSPQQKMHGASSRRPRKRASAPGVSFRTHAGTEYS